MVNKTTKTITYYTFWNMGNEQHLLFTQRNKPSKMKHFNNQQSILEFPTKSSTGVPGKRSSLPPTLTTRWSRLRMSFDPTNL